MDLIEKFMAYYLAFEATYADDDWSRLEPFFAADAVYRVTGSGDYDCELRGRDAVFAGIRKFLDGFDRRCTRRLEAIEAPSASGDSVGLRGAAVYTRGDSPPLRLELHEVVEYRDGRIVRITDNYERGLPAGADEWIRRYGSDLSLSYR